MIFDYPNNKFIEDGRTNRLLIQGFAFIVSNPIGAAALGRVDAQPDEDVATILKDVEFIFTDGILKVLSSNQRITDISKLLFIMSESEVSAAQEQMYRRNYDNNNQAIQERAVFSPEIKVVLQKALEQMAKANGIEVPEGIGFFNDKMILYMFPFLRTVTNASTNFYKILEDLRFIEDYNSADGYTLSHTIMEQKNLSEAVKLYLGTSSKEIIKFIGSNLIKKTDLVKSLSPQLLDVLINHSGKIFAGSGVDVPQIKILTCYEDVNLEVLTYLRFVMDIFKNNIDHTQKFIAIKRNDGFKSSKKIATFLQENFSPKKIFTILSDTESHQGYLTDIANQWNAYKDPSSIPGKLRHEYPNGLELPKFQTLKELHDKVSADYNKIKAEDNNKTIPYTETEWQLHGLKKDGVELMLPSEGATLVTWGKEQNHCVASYAERAASKETLIVGVKVYGKHLYTLEVRVQEHQRPVKPEPQIMSSRDMFSELPGLEKIERISEYSYSINQFYGYSNRTPEHYGDKEIRKVVQELLGSVFTYQDMYSYKVSAVNDGDDALRYAMAAGNINIGVPDDRAAIIQNVIAE